MNLARTKCPHCAKLGKDNASDNLAVYPDGHSYCYSCGYTIRAPLLRSLHSKVNPLKYGHSGGNLNMPYSPRSDSDSVATFNLPRPARDWLDSYGITETETHHYNIWYDLEKDYLVFPIYDGPRLVCTNSRYFGSNPKHPRYITWGLKNRHFKLMPSQTSSVYVLVEDFVSAIKVGRQFNCIPLLGSYIPNNLILSLISSKPILRIWLDPDKSTEAMVAVQKARQYIKNCGTILSNKDPKDYNDQEIKDYVESTFSNSEELSRIYSLPEV
jgi:hypothetical protein